MSDLNRSSDQPGEKITPYIRGPGWPTDTTVSDSPLNPWSKRNWNLTAQVKILKRDRAEADRLARAAGHKDALSARLKTAK